MYNISQVRTLHTACIKFPDVSTTVVPLLMEFLSDTNELAAMDVLIFVREAMSRYDEFMSAWCLIRDLMFQVRDIAANYN